MKTLSRVVGGVATLSLVFSLVGPNLAFAATTPSLGAAASFAVLADTYTNTTAGTTINGDVGYTTPPATTPTVNGATHDETATYFQAGTDQGAALNALNSQLPCDFTFGGATDLSLLAQPLAPGIYCIGGAASIGSGGISLSGGGTYIFRITGALSTVDNSDVTFVGGVPACQASDVFWTPSAAATLGADTTFIGTIVSDAGVTIGNSTEWLGRSLAFGGTITTANDTITVPTACPPPAPGGSSQPSTVTVIKRVINDNGGTKIVSDFSLFVNGTPVSSGTTNTFPAISGIYTVTESGPTGYATAFSGDCDLSGQFNLTPGQNKICIITNNDIGAPIVVPPVPPLLDVVKVPNPLALPNGPGSVTYTYTLSNPGTVPVTDITMVGDSCAPIVRVSGDTDGDNQLDVTETWVHTCSTTLNETHTNTVVATGWANGLSASDIASATVVVGVPVVPPLIHVTKIPTPLTLLVGGGMVTYTERITNPGTVPLSNVTLVDDKCAPMVRVSGDTDGDAMLDTSETWTYTCQSNLTQTTANTATASGQANGFTVRDFAIATVVVATAAPVLPSAGIGHAGNAAVGAIAASIVAAATLLYALRKRRSA
jgi:hypothetical protein